MFTFSISSPLSEILAIEGAEQKLFYASHVLCGTEEVFLSKFRNQTCILFSYPESTQN
jgi:hypothetical protein